MESEEATLVANFNELCRLCMETEDVTVNLFENIQEEFDGIFMCYRDFITHLALIQIDESDSLPSKICEKCQKQIQFCYIIKRQCEISDEQLRKIVNNGTVLADQEEADLVEELREINEESLPSNIQIEILHKSEDLATDFIDELYETNANDATADEEMYEFLHKNESSATIEEEDQDDTPIYNEIVTEFPEDAKIKCDKCEKSFGDKTLFILHMKAVHREFKCEICSKNYSQYQTLSRHMKIHQVNSKTKSCPHCDKCFVRSDDLKRHIRIHTGERPYKCDQCPKAFKQTSELKEHIKIHLNTNNYNCNICNKTIRSRNGYYVHMKSHKGEKNHRCKYCDKKFLTTGELNSHIRHIHTREKLFKCSHDDCDEAFVSKIKLKAHLRSHIEGTVYQCHLCDQTYNSTDTLLEHLNEHGDEGRDLTECIICHEKFGSIDAVKIHIRVHIDRGPESSFECRECDEIFMCSTSLENHIKSTHNVNACLVDLQDHEKNHEMINFGLLEPKKEYIASIILS